MKLSRKLLLSYITVAFLVLLVGATSYLHNQHVKNELIEESRRSLTELQRLASLNYHLQNSLIFTRNFLFEQTREDDTEIMVYPFRSRSAQEAAVQSLDLFASYLQTIKSSHPGHEAMGPEQRLLHSRLDHFADTLSASFNLYRSLSIELFDLEEEVGMGDEMFNLTIEPYFRTTLLPILEDFRTHQTAWVELQMSEIEQRVERNTQLLLILSMFAFALAVLLAYLVYRSITHPLRNLTHAAEEIGSGNFEKRIRIGSGDELAQLGNSFNRMAENLNRSMVSREYVNNIIQSMGDMLVVTDSDYRIGLINRSVADTLDYDDEKLSGREIWQLFDKDEADRIKGKLSRNDLRNSSMEASFLTASGEKIPVILSFSTLKEGAGNPSGFVFVASNITVQKEAEYRITRSLKEKEVLLSEIHHRVKNNLAVISGLLEMQVWNLSREDVNIAPLKESQLRIQSIALVHELLYQSENFSEIRLDQYITKLLAAIRNTHESEKNVDVITELEKVKLTIQKAIPASLVLNELVVNAYKHAFDGRKEGVIGVKLALSGQEVLLQVEDNGRGLPPDFDPFQQKTLGMTLIKTLVRQIAAHFEVEADGKGGTGTRFRIRFEID